MFHKATLPISIDDGVYLNIEEAKKIGESLSGDYCFAEPFPHIVIDNFLPEAFLDKVINNFPVEKLKNDVL